MAYKQEEIFQVLEQLYASIKEKELQFSFLLKKVHPSQQASAVNLLHYLSLRSQDLSDLQEALHEEGLSTFVNAEGYLLSQLLAVMKHFSFHPNHEFPPCDYRTARSIASARVNQMFGEHVEPIPSVMVTFESSYADDFIMVKKLLKAGMNVARINCAHDDEATWLRMIRTLKEVSRFTGIECKIYMDLAGPKIRTMIKGNKGRIMVEEEDIILLTDREGLKSKLPVVQCTLPGILRQLNVGERVFFDDGLIETKVLSVSPDGAELEVVQVSSKKPFLKTEKGINLPDTHLQLPALSGFDRQCLPFIQEHADMVGFSFIHDSHDLAELHDLLKNKSLPVILKIETPEAFDNLPSLLFSAMREQDYGVMIARGDLAVELGFENLGQAQAEILNICRAAHAPVIYATQILESMNKQGLPTRAEITDAANGIFADCVMLNKGIHTAKVVKTLKKILLDQSKQLSLSRPVFRPLEISKAFFKKHKGDLNPRLSKSLDRLEG